MEQLTVDAVNQFVNTATSFRNLHTSIRYKYSDNTLF